MGTNEPAPASSVPNEHGSTADIYAGALNAIRYAKEHTKRTLLVKLRNMDEAARLIFVEDYAEKYPAQRHIVDDVLGTLAI